MLQTSNQIRQSLGTIIILIPESHSKTNSKFDYDKYIKFNPKQKTHPAPHPEKRSVPDLT